MSDDVAQAVEVVRPDVPRGGFRAVLFDFDGTLSLIRRNWQAVMIPMMVDELAATGTRESRDELAAHVENYVMRLNGRQTIYQMLELVEQVRARGGTPLEPLAYKRRYHDLLWQQVGRRVEGLKAGRLNREDYLIAGAVDLLEELTRRGLRLFLASGTDLNYVQDEVRVLGLEAYFGPHIYGALDDYQNFSKAMIIRQIIDQIGFDPRHLLAFGDGFVEIEETRRVGGVAVGVASQEETRMGVDAWKRQRLIGAGADLIIGDYRCREELFEILGL